MQVPGFRRLIASANSMDEMRGFAQSDVCNNLSKSQ